MYYAANQPIIKLKTNVAKQAQADFVDRRWWPRCAHECLPAVTGVA